MKKLSGKLALPAAALVLGIIAGRHTLPSAGPADMRESADTIAQAALHPSREHASAEGAARSGAAGRPLSAGPSITTVLASHDRPGRLRALLSMLDELDAGEFAGVLGQMRADGLDLVYRDEYLLVLSSWAGRDPLGAAAQVREMGGDGEMKSAVMAAWAAADPLAAEQWARDHRDSGEANPWLVGVIQGVASSDVDFARGLIEELPRGRERNVALESTLRHVFLQGGDSAAGWIKKNALTDESLQEDGAEWLAERLAERDPAAAAAWVSSLETADARGDASGEVAERFARQDVEAAQAWVLSLPEDTRLEAAEGVVDQLAREDPVAAFNWLAKLGGGADLDDVRQDIVRRGFERDPAAALTTALHLTDDRDRERFTSRYLERWVESDPAAASGWLEAHARYLPDNTRELYVPAR